MKYLLLIPMLFIIGCATHKINKQTVGNSLTAVKKNKLEWFNKTYPTSVVACTKIKENNIVLAEKISIAKAQAELSYRKQTNIEASFEINNKVYQMGKDEHHNKTVHEKIKQQTIGNVKECNIKKSEVITENNYKKLCILYGPS